MKLHTTAYFNEVMLQMLIRCNLCTMQQKYFVASPWSDCGGTHALLRFTTSYDTGVGFEEIGAGVAGAMVVVLLLSITMIATALICTRRNKRHTGEYW